MKKQQLKNLALNKKSISLLNLTELVGGETRTFCVDTRTSCGINCPFGPSNDTIDYNCTARC